jgi:hypothetical protein
MSKGLAIEWSHGRPRITLRADETTPVTSEESAPMNDPKTGRFLPNNRAYRRRQLKARADGIATLNPAKVPTWMRPHVETGAPYILALLGMLEGKPALHALAGDCADAHVLYRATLALALDAEDAKTRAVLMSEARGWLREHRTALATLSALAGGMKLPEPDPHAALAAAAAEEQDP